MASIAILPIAQAAEASGWTSITIPTVSFSERDGIEVPIRRYGEYSRLHLRHPVHRAFHRDDVDGRGYENLRFYPAVMKVPVRQPLVIAKALSSLAVICAIE